MSLQSIDLTAVSMAVAANAGDDILIPFTANAINTTGWTLVCPLYNANATKTGPDGGASIGAATIVNTPGVNSSITVSIAGSLTAGLASKAIFGALKRTDAGNARTFTSMTFSLQ